MNTAACRECGCTDEAACIAPNDGGYDACWWHEVDPHLCWACTPLASSEWIRSADQGPLGPVAKSEVAA